MMIRRPGDRHGAARASDSEHDQTWQTWSLSIKPTRRSRACQAQCRILIHGPSLARDSPRQ